MRLSEIARLPGIAAAAVSRPEVELRGIVCDSRAVGAGLGFYALAGERRDGHEFLQPALDAGAPALFVTDRGAFERLREAPAGPPAGLFLLPAGREPLADLAAALHGHPSRRLALVAVTGTNGKTTVTHLMVQLLGAMGEPCGLIGSLGMRCGETLWEPGLTTPEAPDTQRFLALCGERGVGTVAMEASSIGIAAGRTRGLEFRAAAFTNLTLDHLDHHGHMDAYRDAKFALFHTPPQPCAVVNRDSPDGEALLAQLEAAGDLAAVPPLPFALAAPAALTARDVRFAADGVGGVLCHEDREALFRSPLVGRFNLSNLLAAAGLLLALGRPLPEIARAAEAVRGAPGRLEPVPAPRAAGVTVLVDYAHTPDALANVLEAVRPLAEGRLWVVFGCGGERDRGKRPEMGAIAERLADRVLLTSDNPRGEPPEAILDEIVAGLRDPRSARRIPDRAEAIRAALDDAAPGDLVLIAGKGHETYQEIDGRRRPFSDQAVVEEWSDEGGA